MTATPLGRLPLPPGPRGFPSRSELLALREGPQEFLRKLAEEHGSPVRFPAGPLRFHLVTHPEGIRSVLVEGRTRFDRNTFQYGLLSAVTGEGLLTMDGPPWLVRRRLAQPSFHRAEIAAFVPMMATKTAHAAERWDRHAASGEPIDAAAEMMHLALQVVASALFSVEVGDQADALARATLDVLHHVMSRARTFGVVPRWLPTTANRTFRRALGRLDAAIEEAIREARRSGGGGDDLLGRLMRSTDPDTGQRLTDRQLRDELMTMLIAGHETVASALAWTWHLLGGAPEADDRLAEEVRGALGGRAVRADDLERLPFTGRVFRETLRLYPPAWLVTRRAVVDVEIGGYRIPGGSLVVVSPYVTHRDGGLWEEPTRFDPDRFSPERSAGRHPLAYIPFGAGGHLCIGSHFAMVEAAVLLATLVARFRLVPAGEGGVRVEPGVTLHPRGGLPMRVLRRD